MIKIKKEYLFLLIILFLALILRIYNIHKQSITFDEFIFISNTNIFDMSTYLSAFFAHHPDYGLSPLTPILIYISLYLLNYSITTIRVVPILFGLGSIAIVYAIGKKMGGEKTGILSSVFLCFSPMNIWIHQEIKCYSFCLFFSLLSFYSLMNFICEEKKHKWLLLGTLSNLTLPWLHPTYIFVPAIQIIITLLFSKTLKLKNFLYWLFQSFVSCILWTSWFFSQNRFFYIPNETYKEKTSIFQIFEYLFCNDSVGLSPDLLPEWKTNNLSILESSFWKTVLPYWYIIDYTLAFLILIFIFVFIIISFPYSKKKIGTFNLFLFYILVIPIFLFLILQFITGSKFFTIQYFMYSLSIFYLCISVLISKIKNIQIKYSFIIIFLILIILESLSLIYFKNRTDYQGAFEHLKKEIPPHGALLGQRFTSVYDVGKIYLQRKDIQFVPILSLNGFIDKSYELLFLKKEEYQDIYLLMEPASIQVFGIEKPESILSQHFEKKNMKVDWKYFPGQYNLFVGKVTKISNEIITKNETIPFPLINGFSYNDLLSEFNFEIQNDIEKDHILKILRNNFYIYPHFPVFYILIVSNLIWENELCIANKVCDKIIEKCPDFGAIYLLKGIDLLKQGDYDKGKKYIENSFKITPSLSPFYGKIITNLTLENQSNYSNTCQSISDMDKSGFVLLDKALLSLCNE